MFTNLKTMTRGRCVTANGAKLVLRLCLLGLASASAAVQTLSVSRTLADGATLGGTLSIHTTGNITAALTAASVTTSAADGAALLGPGYGAQSENICVNVCAFDPNEELISNCSCLVTAGQTVNLRVNAALTSKPPANRDWRLNLKPTGATDAT